MALYGLGLGLALGISSCGPALSQTNAPPLAKARTSAHQYQTSSEYDPATFRTRGGPLPELPASVDLPHVLGCQFQAQEWSGPIRLAAGGPIVANVDKGIDAHVTVPKGDASRGAVIEFELRGLKLKAVVSTPDLKLFAKRAVVFEGHVIPYGFTPLALGEFYAGKGRVFAPPVAHVRTRAEPHGATLDCNDLSLEEQFFEPNPGVAERAPSAHWLGKGDVPLRAEPDGPAIATMDTRPEKSSDGDEAPDPDEVAILGSRGAFRRILWAADTGAVVGWVHAKFLGHSEPFGMIGLLNTGAAGDPREHQQYFGSDDPTQARDGGTPQTCAWNAPLIATAGGIILTIGTIASGIPLSLGQERNGLRSIRLVHPALSLPETTTLWVPETLLYPCVVPFGT